MTYFCGVDIGGTFTDCVILDDQGNVTQSKVSTTPDDPSVAFLASIDEAASQLGLGLEELLAQTQVLLHGTTIGTNALLQRDGAKTGLITTRGHRDALIMMRSAGRSKGLPIEQLLHVSRHRKPEPIVPPRLIKEVTERVDWAGDVVAPLNMDEVHAAVDELLAEDVEAIGVCLLWGFVNSSHERAIRDVVRERAPEVFVTCAHEFIGKPGEYERTAATAVNAFIGPTTASYVRRLQQMTAERSFVNPLLVMQASGGVVPPDEVVNAPVLTIGSGPVGGLAGAGFLADAVGQPNVIATDMGGTSFDVGIIHNGEPLTSSETVINQYTLAMPRLSIESIGAGGGSIVRVDETSRTLRVGPDSAQAQPGPACYGRGGTRPTVTDADVVLGFYDPAAVLSGGLQLDVAAAERAIRTVAEPMGMTNLQAASGAKRIVDSQMAALIRQLTVERGLDPRDFVAYAYGGAAGLHAGGYARELGVQKVVVPHGNLASGWSALGVLSSDLLHVYEHAELLSAPFNAERIGEIYAGLEETARAQLSAEGIGDDQMAFSRFVDMKFSLQIHQVEVEVPPGALTESDMEAQVARFIDRYEEIYGEGSAFPGAGTQAGVFRLRARGEIATPSLPPAEAGPRPEPVGKRDVYWSEAGDVLSTPAYDGASLRMGGQIVGPAVVEFPSTQIVVHPGDVGDVDELGNFVMTLQ